MSRQAVHVRVALQAGASRLAAREAVLRLAAHLALRPRLHAHAVDEVVASLVAYRNHISHFYIYFIGKKEDMFLCIYVICIQYTYNNHLFSIVEGPESSPL